VSVYVDTSGFYAYLCRDDQHHDAVAAVMQQLALRRTRLITTSYAVSPTMGLLQRRMGMRVVRQFMESVIPVVEICWVGPEEHEAAWNLMQRKPKRALTVVDAAGMVIMHRDGIKRCVALDHEFGREGFEMMPIVN